MQQGRYSRQVLFAPIGREGQERLGRSSAVIVGCGALGSVVAEILTRAGVGRLTIADRDYVDETNLQRQSLFTEEDCRQGMPKAIAAASRLRALNGAVEIAAAVADVTASNVGEVVASHDLIVDGTDNFEVRFLLNDASLRWRIPWIYGACVGSYGLALAFRPGATPCLRCILDDLPAAGSSPTCDTAGVIAPVVHLVAALQAAEAMKILTGNTAAVSSRLMTVDVWENRYASVDVGRMEPNPACPACALGRLEFLDGARDSSARLLCGRNAVQLRRGGGGPVDFAAVAGRLAALGTVRYNQHLLRARVESFEIALFPDGRSIIRGTEDEGEARRVYAKLIGG